MKPRRRTIWLLFGLSAICAFVVVGWFVRRDAIDKNGFDQINAGMTKADVEQILKVPAGDYRVFKDARKRYTLDGWGDRTAKYLRWDSGRGAIFVYFDPDDTVVGGTFFPPLKDSCPEMFRKIISCFVWW